MELKHLAYYLTYNTKIQRNSSDKEIIELTEKNISFIISNNDKPLFYPIDYLKKEIEFNGEKFVPIDKLYPDLELNKRNMRFHLLKFDALNCRFAILEKCFEWKIDIFDYIKKGEAIDITTL